MTTITTTTGEGQSALSRVTAARPDLRHEFLTRKALAEREEPVEGVDPLVKFCRVWSDPNPELGAAEARFSAEHAELMRRAGRLA